MTREEFIKLFADRTALGRKKNYPDLRPSEAAMSRMDDEKRGAKLWRLHRSYLITVTSAEYIAEEEASAKAEKEKTQ